MATVSKVRELLSQQFLNALSQGYIPWTACWAQERPLNAITGKAYRGINAAVLSFVGEQRRLSDPRWCTYNQAQQKGWQVMKGAKGVPVEYWAYYDTKEKKLLSWKDVRQKLRADPDYEKHLQLRCRTYTVFNGEQIQGIPVLERRHTDIGDLRDHRDTLVMNMDIQYREGGNEAYYSPSTDTVTLPPEALFDDPYSYMATFLHECSHATGHPNRLDRDLSGKFGSESYAREELRAEIASAFTAQSIGLHLTPEQLAYQTDRHAGYIQHWASILKDSPDELFRAIKSAEEISDYLLVAGEFRPEPEIVAGAIGSTHYTLSSRMNDDGMVLTISGSGKIPDTDNLATRPYQAHAAAIREVIIKEGITQIGNGVLQDLPSLEKIVWPSSLRSIGYQHLESCSTLREIEFVHSSTSWTKCTSPHSPRELAAAADAYPMLTVDQLEEVCQGIRDGHTEDQVKIYARPEFSPLQINSLRLSVAEGLTGEQLAVVANPAFNALQMDWIRAGFSSGMTIEQVSAYAKPEFSPEEMMERYWQIYEDPSWMPELPEDPKEPPMSQSPEDLLAQEHEREFWEMNDFLEKGGNIAELADWYERDLDGPDI